MGAGPLRVLGEQVGAPGRAVAQRPRAVRRRAAAAPASTTASLGPTGPVTVSTTSATMQVMLSGPPLRRARLISCSTASLRVGVADQRLVQRLLGDHVGQPVRAQQVPVAQHGLAHLQVRLGVRAGLQGAHDQRPLRVGGGRLRGQPALVDQRLHQGVIPGDLVEVAVAQHVGRGSRRCGRAPPGPPTTAARSASCPCPRSRGRPGSSRAASSWPRPPRRPGPGASRGSRAGSAGRAGPARRSRRRWRPRLRHARPCHRRWPGD